MDNNKSLPDLKFGGDLLLSIFKHFYQKTNFCVGYTETSIDKLLNL